MRLYTDAAADVENGAYGVGYVLDCKTGATITGKRYVYGDYSSMGAEWLALMQGLDVSVDNITSHDDEIFVYVDCDPLVDKMHEPADLYDDKWHARRKQTLGVLFEFEDYDVSWEQRASTQQNKSADRLAREALWQARGDNSSGNAVQGLTFDKP